MMHRDPPIPAASLALACVLACAAPPPALAQWSSDPSVNTPICTEPGSQALPRPVPDGDGGLIVAWSDARSGAPALYAQRLDRFGYPLWGVGGQLVSPNLTEWTGAAVSDGAGGTIVAWKGADGGANRAVFAQRLSPLGTALWGAGGVAVSVAPAQRDFVLEGARVAIAPDGSGGAALAWADTAGFLRVQRLDANGQLAWPAEVALGSTYFWDRPQVTSDGAGGLIVGWRSAPALVYAQRVDAAGATRWGATGVNLSGAHDGRRPNLVEDGAGGAIVTWMGYFPGVIGSPLVAQRLDSLGAKLWGADGVQAVPGSADQGDSLLADGDGGAFVVWNNTGVRVQHLGPAGAPLWDSAGVAMNSFATRASPVLAPAPEGGVFVAWSQGDGWGNTWVFAQSLSAAGVPRWGLPVGLSTLSPGWFVQGLGIVGDGDGGLLATWADGRNEAFAGSDVFAQRVGAGGTLEVGPLPRPAALSLAAGPVPSRRGERVSLRLVLARAGRARVTLHDVSGRLVRVLEDGAREAGTHALRWDGRDRGGRSVAPGLYLVRVVSGSDAAAARIVVTD